MQDATRSADLRFGALRNDGYAERADGYGVARSVSSGRVRIHGGSIGQIKLGQPAERLAFAPRNAADESFDGTPNASIYTARRSATAAAQEPEAYAMFLAGLGLIGLMVRRRWTRIDR